jgi:hypothetical protein
VRKRKKTERNRRRKRERATEKEIDEYRQKNKIWRERGNREREILRENVGKIWRKGDKKRKRKVRLDRRTNMKIERERATKRAMKRDRRKM